jgi:transposase InsO family protein
MEEAQYASGEYAERLEAVGLQRSMSRPGNPYDNAKAESFMKTLKAEEVDGRAYADLAPSARPPNRQILRPAEIPIRPASRRGPRRGCDAGIDRTA